MSSCIYFTFFCCFLAVVAAFIFTKKVMSIPIHGSDSEVSRFRQISGAIEEGALAFLKAEYFYVALFCLCFSILVFFALSAGTNSYQVGVYSSLSFLLGAFISTVAAFLGMIIATKGNIRTTISARTSLSKAFTVAYNSGAVMGFGLCGLAVFGLMVICLLYMNIVEDAHLAMEMVSGFGLGGSTVALFGRVGGGIYTKAADIGADLVGKVEKGIPEDDPRNPAVIADNVGDNVGDIAGMGADLFGSIAEATCAALLIGATVGSLASSQAALYFPILISAVGIPICLLTVFFVKVTEDPKSVEKTLKNQLLISTFLMSIALFFLTKYCMVEQFNLGSLTVTKNGVLISTLAGLWGGLIIGLITEYYTSHTYKPVQQVAEASKTGAATNIIYGLSLGYQSSVLPVLCVALITYLSWSFAGMYGISLAALGMLSTIAIGLTIDAYGPVSDNAGGIAEMCGLEKEVRKKTDILDAAGNTTAAIGKGFAIGSAVLTGLALFAAFLTRSDIQSLNLISPTVFSGIFTGAVLPMLFSALTMRAVGTSAYAMIEEVRHQFRTIPGLMEGKAKPNYKQCVAIATESALKEMIAPGILVIASPLVLGSLFGIKFLAGVLAGSLATGIVQAISAANSGGAWDNAKKYIETGAFGGKGSETHKAAVVGDTVGDPMKDTSGPSLNILMKLMAIISLVFSPFIIWAHAQVLSFFS